MNVGGARDGRSESDSEILYRFPHSRAAVELVPDIGGAFRLRLNWHRGKTILTPFETSALRPAAEVLLRGQRFPIFLNQCSRKRRDRILLGGRRKTARSARAALRSVVAISGRDDAILWHWRIGATAAALANAPLDPLGGLSPDQITLHLPFAPGHPQRIQIAGEERGVAVWVNDLAVTVVSRTPGARLGYGPRCITLVLEPAELGGDGASLLWETRLLWTRSEAEVADALQAHLADVTDDGQVPTARPGAYLMPLAQRACAALTAEDRIEKRTAERHLFRASPGDTRLAVVGETADAAQASTALLAHFFLTGDDALRRRARLTAQGLCDFQVTQEESPHWGAIWDALHRRKRFADRKGEATLSARTTARAVRGLHLLHAHFGVDLLARTALSGAQWLLLKMDRHGFLAGERFQESGPLVAEGEAPWATTEVLAALATTFRHSGNEAFLKAALRALDGLREAIEERKLLPDVAPTEALAAGIEGALLISREYENDACTKLARSLSHALRARRQPDGLVIEPFQTPRTPLAPTTGAIRAALALARVDDDPRWLIFALRGLRALNDRAGEDLSALSVADLGALALLPLHALFTAAARAPGSVADLDRLVITRGWQTFAPDPATRDFVQVTTEEDAPVDHLALVCPISLQVLLAVVASPDTETVKVIKNQRPPYLKNLLTGEVDVRVRLSPLGDGVDARIGVFLADT